MSDAVTCNTCGANDWRVDGMWMTCRPCELMRDRISDEIERISVALPPAEHLSTVDIWAEANGVAEGAARIDAFMSRRGHQLKWLIQTYRDGEAEALLELLRAEFWGMEPGEWPAAAGALRPGKEPR